MSIYKQYGPNYRGEIIGTNEGTAVINKCYYLKTQDDTQAIYGTEDNTLDVIQCTNKSEITAQELNNNINSITHEEEWKTWEEGSEYPILKFD